MTPANDDSPGRVLTRRDLLVACALEVLDEQGPAAVTSRRVAERAGTTTMAVYTEFGSLGGLTRAVVDAGFAELARAFAQVGATDDPVSDLVAIGLLYHGRALARPHLYAVMFGTAALGGYRRAGDELTQGIETFEEGVDAVARAMDAGRLTRADPFLVCAQLWTALHGQIVLQASGMLDVVADPLSDVLAPAVLALLIGFGDDAGAAATSMLHARERVQAGSGR